MPLPLGKPRPCPQGGAPGLSRRGITGLSAAGLILANGSDTLSVSAGATIFSMPTGVAQGAGYDVTVQANPPGVSCAVSNGSGTAPGEVTTVSITCTPGSASPGADLTDGIGVGSPQAAQA